MAYIYKLVLNKAINRLAEGCLYIGKHNGRLKNYYGSGDIIKGIIRKHGSRVFTKEIIVEGDFNIVLVEELEKHYIRLYNSYKKYNSRGLNLTQGGRFGAKATAVTQYSPEGYRIKRWDTVFAAASFLGCCAALITKAANGTYKEAAGYQWRYDDLESIPMSNRSLHVNKFDRTEVFIKKYPSAKKAAISVMGRMSCINGCCNGSQKSHMGYLWSYGNIILPLESGKFEGDIVLQVSSAGEETQRWNSLRMAANSLGVTYDRVRYCVKTGVLLNGFLIKQIARHKNSNKWASAI